MMNSRGTSRLFVQGQARPLKGSACNLFEPSFNKCGTLTDVLRVNYPWCAEWRRPEVPFLGSCRPSRGSTCSTTTIFLLYWARMVSEASNCTRVGGRFSHTWSTSKRHQPLQAAICLARNPADAGGRFVGGRRAIDLWFAAPTVRKPSWISRSVRHARAAGETRPQLSLGARRPNPPYPGGANAVISLACSANDRRTCGRAR